MLRLVGGGASCGASSGFFLKKKHVNRARSDGFVRGKLAVLLRVSLSDLGERLVGILLLLFHLLTLVPVIVLADVYDFRMVLLNHSFVL